MQENSNVYHIKIVTRARARYCSLKSFPTLVRATSNYRRSVVIFFGTARFYHPAVRAMKYRRRNISMHVSYCVCPGGNREPRGRRKNYLTSKSSLRDVRVSRSRPTSRLFRESTDLQLRKNDTICTRGLTTRVVYSLARVY